jgi:Fe-S-cluster-containing dehydrogenase component
LYRNGDASVKDREENGYGFIKKACMHCVDPDCVSACPVTALEKDEVTGVVTYDAKACIGCRYCQVACPFNIPKFEWDDPFPEIVKCQMCDHVQGSGGIPGCCYYCPTGASLYGKVEDLMIEAHKRIEMAAGTVYNYPVKSLKSGETTQHTVPEYVNYIYGEKETGGTQYMIISAIPFHKLGLPRLAEKSSASKSETLQHTIYKGLIAPGALLAGLLVAAYRGNKSVHANEEGGSNE